MNRRGFTLIEIILTTSIVVVLLLVLAPLSRLFWNEVMRTQNDFETHISLSDYLESLEQDVQNSHTLRLETSADGRVIHLTSPDHTIQYKFCGDTVSRYSDLGQTPSDEWTLPDVQWQIELWPAADNPKAITIQTSICRRIGGDTAAQFQNSKMFFICSDMRIEP